MMVTRQAGGSVGARRRTAHVLVVMALLSVILIAVRAPAAHADSGDYPGSGYYYDYNTGGISTHSTSYDGPNASQPDWMSWVDGTQSLASLSIPGTHESMSHVGGIATQTQGLCNGNLPGTATPCDLTEQLNSGIRFFDLRVSCINRNLGPGPHDDALEVFHGETYLSATLSDAVGYIQTFLRAHGRETILLQLTVEYDDVNPIRKDHPCTAPSANSTFAGYPEADHLYRDFINNPSYASLFFDPRSIVAPDARAAVPTLDQARGRIELITSQFHFPDDLHLSYLATQLQGVGGSTYNVGIDRFDQLPAHYAQVASSVTDADNAILSGTNTKYWYNAFSGSSGLLPDAVAYGDGVTVAGQNYRFLKDLLPTCNPGGCIRAGQWTSTGIVGFDFPGGGLLDGVIGLNLRHVEPNITGSDRSNLQSSFSDMVKMLAPSTTGNSSDRLSQLWGYFGSAWNSNLNQGIHGAVVDGGGTTGWDTMHETLYGSATGVDGRNYVIWSTGSQAQIVSNQQLQDAVDADVGPLTGRHPSSNADALRVKLTAQYPGTEWDVVARHCDDNGAAELAMDNYNYDKGCYYSVEYFVAEYRSNPTATAVNAVQTPVDNQPATFTAHVTVPDPAPNGGTLLGQPDGVVTFLDGSIKICSSPVPVVKDADTSVIAATATCQVPKMGPGAHSITATYSGGGYLDSTSTPLTFTVTPVPTTVVFLNLPQPMQENASATGGPIKIGLQDDSGVEAPAAVGGLPLAINTTSATGSFSKTPGGTPLPVTTLLGQVFSVTSVPAGATFLNLYYGDTHPGTPTFTVVADSLPSQATQNETVTPVTFPTTRLGATSSPYIVIWVNKTTTVQTVSSVTVTPNPPFSVIASSDVCTGHRLAAGASCRLQVVFHPTTAGQRSGTVDIATAAGGHTTLDLVGNA